MFSCCCCNEQSLQPAQMVAVDEQVALPPAGTTDIEENAKAQDLVLEGIGDQGELSSSHSTPSPPASPSEFRVEMAKDAEGMTGLVIATTQGMVIVAKEPDGPARLWNENNPPHVQIRIGDRVLEVNDASDSPSDILHTMRQSKRLKMRLRHSTVFSVLLDKEGHGLGLALDETNDDIDMLHLRGIAARGVVSDWNAAHPNRCIQVNDRIVRVNGLQGDADGMLECLRSNSKLELDILRIA
mmetsp:Transcript_62198/g.115438  ORF Transcript_62198/g.115438 Transcript_62198/m.115438 type:complete len:241 (+) Transcript_62198:98-820(+)